MARRRAAAPVDSYYEYVLASDRWARFRERLLCARGRRCERCQVSQTQRDLELHHLTYERLGCERDDDVQVLCVVCHVTADREREAAQQAAAAERLYAARVDGWASKRYGEDWDESRSYDEVADAFEDWLERRGEDEW